MVSENSYSELPLLRPEAMAVSDFRRVLYLGDAVVFVVESFFPKLNMLLYKSRKQ